MLRKLYIYEGTGHDPYENLAIEKHLLDTVEQDACVLYLWQNQNTVVIGRNQNAWAECRTSLLSQEGGILARRLSGGGAVFHDLGNLNFTFLMQEKNYDVDRQLSVIQAACALAGIRAEKSGRNDLLAQGRKFSGNAFYRSQGRAYHHGTLLINVDEEKLQRYLCPSKAKLEAKGIQSVRSRVINLSTLAPGLTCDTMRQYMRAAFSQVYRLPVQPLTLGTADLVCIEAIRSKNASWEYNFGSPLPFSFSCEERFPWGNVQLQLQAKNGTVQAARLYTDAMEWDFAAPAEQALTGCRFQIDALTEALAASVTNGQIARDLCRMLRQQNI